MKRFELKNRRQEWAIIEKKAKEATSVSIEDDTEILNKLFSGRPYNMEDIQKCGKTLLERFHYNYEQQFRTATDVQEFNQILKNIDLKLPKPVFIVFAITEQWVLLCLANNQNKNVNCLYKDSRGKCLPQILEDDIKKKFPEIEFFNNTNKDQEDEEHYLSGPLVLRNLKLILDNNLLNDNDTFGEFQFCHSRELHFSKVIKLTAEIAENKNFKIKLTEFINKLPLELEADMVTYRTLLAEELEKDENDIDYEKLKTAKDKLLNPQKIEKLTDDFKLNISSTEKDMQQHKLSIETDFPKEMEKLKSIFLTLHNIKVDKELFSVLENISEILDIDVVRLKSFYQSKINNEETEIQKKLLPLDINYIIKHLPNRKEGTTATNCTPLEQLLTEITLGMDDTEQNPEEIKILQRRYNLVKEKYTKWSSRDISEIQCWATEIKGHLGTSEDNICETIAIMDRAFNLLTPGYRLRDTQILAVLVFFHEQKEKGILCQIQTGEGKTIIVSLLAVIKALQGYNVDVITSNSLLAADGVEETKIFYSTFNLTVATNNHEDACQNDFKLGYSADVLYGTISNFQFDYLKDTCEGFNIRQERKFGQVILDEVDSMLVDNGGHIAKLASPYPGMECLRYIYIKIWVELHKAEKEFVQETQEKIQEIVEKAKSKNEDRLEYEKTIQEIIQSGRKNIKEKIKASNPCNIPLIPMHLKDYVNSKLDIWIKNALHAKNNCHEHQQYRIITNDAGEKIVAPVDYLNTGVTLKNTIWSNGLHQFIQLKHNIYLTFESLTSSFISNIGYIKKYQNKNIFGLTGTLGSKAEQNLLNGIYNVNYAKLPTYKEKKFIEIPGIIADNTFWHAQLTLEVIEKIDEGRAVLVIFETEQDLMTIDDNLKIFQNLNFRIRKYANEENAKETTDKVQIGDIILATNIAGRGTNFRTEDDLEANGGLHVCVGFLPCNKRVEDQAFGRTSRQGNSGTAQLIIRQSEVNELNIKNIEPNFAQIKDERDKLEANRLKEINDILVKELNFKDELFDLFSTFYRTLKVKRSSRKERFVLQDLKEFWAFWLDKKNFQGDNLGNKTPQREFTAFEEAAKTIIKEGKIQHNPFYYISLADYYLEDDNRSSAAKALNCAIEMNQKQNLELLAGAHLKLFEIAVRNGEQVMERFKEAVAKIFFVPLSKNEHYKTEARDHLSRARTAVIKEIAYIEGNLQIKSENEESDFQHILNDDEKNIFLHHIYSKYCCLKIHVSNIEQLEERINNIKGGVDIAAKTPNLTENLKTITNDIDVLNYINGSELAELQSIGIDAMYSLKEICDVPDTVIKGAQGQIGGGFTCLILGLCFLPIFPAMSSLAGTLISEGVIDIVMELITRGNQEFNKKEYVKGKFISYAISLITFGIGAISQSVSILKKAVSYCRKLSSILKNSQHLTKVCNSFAKLLDRMGDVLEKLLKTAQFNKLSKAAQLDELTKLQQTGRLNELEHLGGLKKIEELQNLQKVGKLRDLTRVELLVNFAKEVVVDTSKDIIKAIAKEKVLKPLLQASFAKLIEEIKKYLKEHLKNSIKENNILMEKLHTTSVDNIETCVAQFMEENDAAEIAKEIGFGMLNGLNNDLIDALILTYDSLNKTAEIIRHSHKFASYLDQELTRGDNNNNVDELVKGICSQVADQIISLITDVVKNQTKNLFSFIKNHAVHETVQTEESLLPFSSRVAISEEDPYLVLGLPRDASAADVKKKFRLLALQMHPDKNPSNPNAKENFQKINNAYEKIIKKSEEKQ